MGDSNSVIVVAVVLYKSSKEWEDNRNVKKWYLILELLMTFLLVT